MMACCLLLALKFNEQREGFDLRAIWDPLETNLVCSLCVDV